MMGRVLACVAFILGSAVAGGAETIVTGNITGNATWTAAGSPYVIRGGSDNSVLVRFNSTLAIEPGVQVRFEDGQSLETESGSAIVALGAPGDSIVFTSASATPSVGIWTSVTVLSSTGSSFEHCVFRYAKYGLYLISCQPAPPISHCTFRRCEYGISCARSSPAITACEISECTVAGIFCSWRESVPTIYHCNLYGNPGRNVSLENYVAPLVTIVAEFNWWGTNTQSEIEASIWDNVDDAGTYGVVDFDPWLAKTAVERTSWGRIKALFAE
jgi:hypothetical protein